MSISEKCFNNLRIELSNAIIAFGSSETGSNIHFNGHDSFLEFKKNLNKLYCDFLEEIRGNLSTLQSEREKHIYLEMLLHVFEILDDQNNSIPDFVMPHRNAKMVSQNNSNLTCIHTNPDDLTRLLSYFQLQKKIIRKSIKFIEVFNSSHKKNFKNGFILKSCAEELKEIYPLVFDLKSKLGPIKSISGKIELLQQQKISMFERMEEEGKETFLIILKFFFEIILDCMKDLLVIEQDILKAPNDHSGKTETRCEEGGKTEKRVKIQWLESKAALTELIYALHASNAIDANCGIKELATAFESIFNMDMGDIYHTYHELKNRKLEPAKFIDSLKSTFIRKIEKEIER
jgi:hypothetical protein